MKLRLPNKLQAALVAALASVSFTTLSTGTIAVATGAALLAGQQAQAADEELTTFTTTNYNAGTVNNFNAKGFIITLNGPRLTTSPTNTYDLVYLDSITLASLRDVPGGSSVTLALADANGKVLSLSNNVVSSTGQAKWDFSNTTVATDSPLYFYWLDTARGIAKGDILTSDDMATWNNAGCGGSGVSNYNNTQNLTSCGFLEALSVVQNTQYAPKLTIVTSGPVPQAEYTWNATSTPAYWDEQTNNWTLRDVESKYTSGVATIVNFNDGAFAKEVTVVGAIEAGTVNVGANYEFTVGSGASLSISKLSVASGAKVTVKNAGELYLAKVTGAGALEVGAGTVNLFGSNDFSGGLTVNGGVVHTTQVSALGTGTRTATGTGVIEIENTAPGNLTVLGDGTLRLMTTYAASSQQSNVELANIQAANLSLAADEHHSSRFRNQNNPDLSGVGHLHFDGGQFWVSNDFAYSGTVTFNETVYKEARTSSDNTLNDAALRVNANATFTGKVDVAHDTRFTWQSSGKTVEFGNEVVGSGDLELIFYGGQNNNTFRISGDASEYAGSITTVNALTLDITSGGKLSIGSASSLAGAVSLAGVLNVNDSATISGAISGAGTLTKNGAGTLTLSGNNSSFTGATNVNAGTLSMNGNSLGGILTVETDAAATFSGAVTLASYIRNSGSVTFNAGSTLTLTCTLDDLVGGDPTYTAGDNGFIAGIEKRIASGEGTVTGLTSVTIGGTTYTKDNGQITDDGAISIHDPDYSTYYLRTEGAEVDVPAQQTDHTEFKNISVAGKGGATITGNILVNGTVSLDSLNIASGNTAAVALSEGATAATANIAALPHGGTLDIGSGVTVHYSSAELTVGPGETLTTTGEGTFDAGKLNANGGTITFDTAATVSRLIVNGSAAATVGGSGAIAVTSTTEDQGVEIGVGKTLTLLTANMNVAGTIHNNGNLIVGDGTNPALVKAVYFVNGNNNGGSSSFDIKANATLVATGADTNNSHASGWVMGEWNNSTTGKVAGTLLARNASIWGCDSAYTLNIENGGLVATKGVRAKKDNQAYTVNLKEGGTLVLGGTSTPGATVLNATAGSTIGTYATSGVDYSGTIATTAVDGKAVTFDTSLYTFNEAGTAITKGDTAGELTISGAITGTAAVAKAGAGTLVLTGANTYSGGTTVNAGTLKAASADALGAGDVTVNCGTLELTTTTAVAGDLTVNDGGTLVFAGANMLTADNLALGSGSVTFDLSNISVTRAGTVTLATADTSASLGSASVQVVWEGLAPIFHYNEGVQVSGNSWVITLTTDSQDLYWNGGTANWDATAESWHTEAAPEEPIAFTNGDTAIFAADTTQAVANISGAIEAAGVIVREDADVVLQAAQEAETATLDAPEIEISGALVSSVDMTASGIVGRGTAATWEIAEGSTVSTATLSAEEGATLTISGEGRLHAETVTGEGTIVFTGDIQPEYSKIVVAEGKELTLDGSVTRTISKDNLAIDGKLIIGEDYSLTIDGQYNPGTAGTDLHIRNNGSLAVSLGNDQNVLRMDEQSEGNLEIKSGNISYLSELGKQTVTMDNGTQLWFGENAGTQDAPVFDNNIVLNGDVTLRVYGNTKHTSVTISGNVSGANHTLTKSDGNQDLIFTGVVNLGGLNTTNNGGGSIIFAGGEGSIGKISTPTSVTIKFSKADGADTASYTFDTFAMSPGNNATRWLIVDAGVTVHGTGADLGDEHNATIMNSWGVNNGGLEVNGTLNTVGVIGMDSGTNTSYLKGIGTINTKGLDLCNGNTSYIQGGITINITSGTGIYRRNAGNTSAIHLLDATLQAKDADWEFKTGGNNYTVTLDSASGTTFDAAANHTITLSKEMGGSGKLVKAGEGTVLVKGANSYSGGTAINKGTLETKNASALGTGNVSVGGNGTLLVSENLTIKGDSNPANNGLDNQGIVSIADGKTLTLWGLASAKHYNLGAVDAAGDSAIIENTNHCATISLGAVTGEASSVVLYSNHSSDPATWNLGTADAGTYSADELVLRVGDSTTTGGSRTVNYNFNNAEMFSGTTVTIENAAIGTPGKTMTNNVVLNADEVHVGGINDGEADTVVDKRNWSVTKGGDVEGRATLVLDGNDTEAAYSTAIKVGANVDIRKTGEGVQTFSGNMDDFEGTVAVEKGTINVLNVDELSVQNVHIGEGAVFGVYSGDTATASTGTEGSIAITENNVLSVLENATLNANLVMKAGSKLDVHAAQLGNGLHMGSKVTLESGTLLTNKDLVVPADDFNAYLFEYLSNNDYYYLYDDVEEFYIQQGGTTQQVYELKFTDWRHFDLDASRIFTNLNENTYALVYNWNADNTGRVALVMIPEPTTGTLSLLALAALAARRRRR